ncbi:DUF1361 domain-containing protein [Siphonobacter aquaeclarae]|jgi:uncharacterized membrane protein|uniref:Uncharacterized membrane protein n=1 Tax=Siphonobacter aquaeclarae TaxID=563176 RepID=A0A1G9SMF8_9BACT|nr:DUF1361 domain-containing protein [Siphonobacter aquaeclarae]SDM35965.1 Uncharacterized membrane protein [Siphonobacter aquaeclarae]
MTRRFRLIASLAALSALSVFLLVVRYGLSREGWYVFINWNLFLAWIPLGLSLWFEKQARERPEATVSLTAIGLLWLLFFPNAPYVITDLVHIQNTSRIPVWHDAVMIFSYALVCLACGLASFHWMRRSLRQLLPVWGDRIMLATLPLAGFGIYLGRVQRLNSWHPLTRPMHLIREILSALTARQALLMTVEFSLLIGFCYLLLLSLMPKEES